MIEKTSEKKKRPSPRRKPGTSVRPTPAPPPAQPAPQVITGVPIGLPQGLGLQVQQVQVWQGQFPPPEAIERYEKACPGTFDRLIGMAEKQQEAAIIGTAEARDFLQKDIRRGHWLGFLLALIAVMGAVVCAYFDHPWVAVALVGIPVLSVAKALVDSARDNSTAIPVTPQPSDKDSDNGKDED